MVSCNAASKVTMQSMGSLELLLRASVFTVLDLNVMGGMTLPREVLVLNALNACDIPVVRPSLKGLLNFKSLKFTTGTGLVTVKTRLCALSDRSNSSFFSLMPVLFCGGPLFFYMPCLVRQSLISFLNGATNSAISSRTLWTIFLAAKTSNKPISLTTRLAVNLNLWKEKKKDHANTV